MVLGRSLNNNAIIMIKPIKATVYKDYTTISVGKKVKERFDKVKNKLNMTAEQLILVMLDEFKL